MYILYLGTVLPYIIEENFQAHEIFEYLKNIFKIQIQYSRTI